MVIGCGMLKLINELLFIARFSPEDKYSRQRLIIKKRFGLLLTQRPEPVYWSCFCHNNSQCFDLQFKHQIYQLVEHRCFEMKRKSLKSKRCPKYTVSFENWFHVEVRYSTVSFTITTSDKRAIRYSLARVQKKAMQVIFGLSRFSKSV